MSSILFFRTANENNLRKTVDKSGSILYNNRMETKKGGRHGGAHTKLSSQSDSQLSRSINSFRRRIDEHNNKISNPSKHADGWFCLNEFQKKGLLRK
jgi:hypothetical protein